MRQFGADRLYPSTSFIVKNLEAFGCLGPPDSAETLVPACGEEASGYSLLVRLLIQPCVHHHQLEVQTSLKKEKKISSCANASRRYTHQSTMAVYTDAQLGG